MAKAARKIETHREVVTPISSTAIQNVGTAILELSLIGDAPYLSNGFPPDKLKELEDGKGTAKKIKKIADPNKEWRSSLRSENGYYWIPGSAFKSAIVDGARFIGDPNLNMTFVKGAVRVMDKQVPIVGSQPTMATIPNKNNSGQTVISYHGKFDKWSVSVKVRYSPGLISPEQIVQLFDVAGQMIGIGGGRPFTPKGKGTGSNGTWRVATE